MLAISNAFKWHLNGISGRQMAPSLLLPPKTRETEADFGARPKL